MIPRAVDLVVGRRGARFLGRRFACSVGRGGVSAAKREGDGATPAGVMRIEAVLARPDRITPPAGAAPMRRRMGWADDPADPAYNQPVARPHRFGAEALWRPDRLYDLVAVLDWNRGPAVAGAGSAIFLHVRRGPGRPTEGCVAFELPDLAWILARWTGRSRVVVQASAAGRSPNTAVPMRT